MEVGNVMFRPGRTSSSSGGVRSVNEEKYAQNNNGPRVASQPQRYHSFDPSASQPQPYNPTMSANLRSASAASPNSYASESNANRTANLLSLLKFNQPTATAQGSTAQQGDTVQHQETGRSPPASEAFQGSKTQDSQSTHGRGISASDLVASFMGKPSSPAPKMSAGASATPNQSKQSRPIPALSLSQNPQDFLLKLLNQTKSSQSGVPSIEQSPLEAKSPDQQISKAFIEDLAQDLADTSIEKAPSGPSRSEKQRSPARNGSPIRIFGNDEITQPTPFEPPQVPKKDSIFTYVNPFEQLAASSPRNRTPISDKSRSENVTSAEENLGPSRNGAHGLNVDGNKRKIKEPLPAPEPSSSRRKLTPSGGDILASIESSSPALLPDGRSQLEALMGIGAPTKNAETVAEALNEVGEKVNKQVEEALSKAEESIEHEHGRHQEQSHEEEATLVELERKVQDTAVEVKKELDKAENKGVLEETMPEPVAEAIRDLIDDAAQGTLADSWESADGEESPTKGHAGRDVRVYNFPIRPFVSITIKSDGEPAVTLQEDSVMDIARLKKEFDQIDRTLATATTTLIVYAMSKNGGLRVIRQDDGVDRQIFRTAHDRVFNVAITTGAQGGPTYATQAAIATGVSGSVYWALISQDGQDMFEDDSMEKHGLIFPPIPAQDDNSSGGQLKTRAKKSCRHPEFFAIGRGKSIHIVWPFLAGESRYGIPGKARTVDAEKFFKERSLKITTGKAGKDFTFSEDDSLIVSLDKAGSLKFWDIRDLVNEANSSASKIAAIEVKTPLMTFNTVSPAEKSWPTSVLFVDKARPYAKGIALRYLIVGMKQNHTMQLWDLSLGKAIQELNFPHAKESDGICSIAYNPNSSIIVVGHPTRNSIYFVHLSAPRHTLPPMSQAKFMQRLAHKDPTLPKPDATAIMTGIREFSFASKGQLRSIDLLPVSNDSGSGLDPEEDQALFELYAMHSKGVTCLSIKRKDLGWSKEGRAVNSVDAEEESIIVVKDLRELHVGPFSEPSSVNGDQSSPPQFPATTHATKSVAKDTARKAVLEGPKPNPSQRMQSPSTIAISSDSRPAAAVMEPPVMLSRSQDKESKSMNKIEKKKKNRAGTAESSTRVDNASVLPSQTTTSSTYASAAQRAISPVPQHLLTPSKTPSRSMISKAKSVDAREPILATTMENQPAVPLATSESISLGISGDFLNKELKKIEKGVLAEFHKVIGHELNSLYRRFDEDKRVQDAAGAAKQDAILRLVSSTLSENVEKSLARIITTNIQQVVLPSIMDVTSSTLDRRLQEVLSHHVHQSIPRELRAALPEAISRAMQNPEVLRVISDLVANKVAAHVESEFSAVLHSTISPAFKNLAVGAAQKMTNEVERRVGKQIHETDARRHDDSQKIEQLTILVRSLSETIHTMATAQSDFQHEFLKLQRQLAQSRQEESSRTPSSQQQRASTVTSGVRSPPQAPQKTPEQEELEAIASLMNGGRYEEGTILWLQSTQQAELFDGFFVRCSPAYLQQLSPLIALSVGAAVTNSLETHVMERLHWLETVFATIDPRDPEIREVAPKIMDVLSQRLEGQYMRIAEADPRDPVLRKIPPLTRQARELKSRIH
ncbi:MAG: hypothetical protein M1830_000760 [Pleopsidium flavum]|nr:MAG: hypothetical protein M1830_000760 [Pleopsidium flavum]